MQIRFRLDYGVGGGLDFKPVAFFFLAESWNHRVASSELAPALLCSPLLPRLLALAAVTPEVKWAAEAAQFSAPAPKGVGPLLALNRFVGVV